MRVHIFTHQHIYATFILTTYLIIKKILKLQKMTKNAISLICIQSLNPLC